MMDVGGVFFNLWWWFVWFDVWDQVMQQCVQCYGYYVGFYIGEYQGVLVVGGIVYKVEYCVLVYYFY